MNYVGFATWVGDCCEPPLTPDLVVHWDGGVLSALPTLEAPGMGEAHKGEDPFLHI